MGGMLIRSYMYLITCQNSKIMNEAISILTFMGLFIIQYLFYRRRIKRAEQKTEDARHAFQIERGRRDMAEKNLRGLHRVETMLLDNPVGKKVTNKIGREYTVIGYLKMGDLWVLKLGTGQKKGGWMYEVGTMKPENAK